MREKILEKFRQLSKTKKIVIVLVGVIFIFIILRAIFGNKAPVYQFVKVTQGSIQETVSVTGNTTPTQSVSLGFGNSGNVARIYSAVGDNASSGKILAELDTSDLYSQLKQAQANVDTAQANYNKVLNGATQADIDVTKAAVNTAQVNLDQTTKQQNTLVQNAYSTLLNSTLEAQPADASVTIIPTITGAYTKNTEGVITITASQTNSGGFFSISGIENGVGVVSTSNPEPIGDTGLYLEFPSLTGIANKTWTITIPNTNAANYLTNYNLYQQALKTKDQAISAAQSALDQANASLTKTTSVARPEDIAAAKAQLDSAQAGVDSINAKLRNSRIISPIDGVITQFDAKVGQFAALGTPLISIISQNSFEVDALVSETDIGKVSIGDEVSMTLDAFSGETFTGKVFYVDPAQTTTSGVVGYKVKVSFDKPDSRMKSGLTANLIIQTRNKDNVLILPQYAILQNDQGNYVEVLENKAVKNIPVQLGLVDQNGNVEVISGVTADQQVINIGLK